MIKQKIKIGDVNTYFYKVNKYTTLHIDLLFVLDYDINTYFLIDLLVSYMFETNKKYKTRKELLNLKYSMYSFNTYINYVKMKDSLVLSVSFEIIHPKFVKDEYFDKLMKEINVLIFDAIRFGNCRPLLLYAKSPGENFFPIIKS